MDYYDKFDHMYTDETGDKHPCYVQDTMEGKSGYTGIVYLDRENPESDSVEKFAFVENDRVQYM